MAKVMKSESKYVRRNKFEQDIRFKVYYTDLSIKFFVWFILFQVEIFVTHSINQKGLIFMSFFQDYTITMYLNQYWKDERLSFSPEENKILTLSGDFAEKIWVPDTFFANDKNRFGSGALEKLLIQSLSYSYNIDSALLQFRSRQ